MTPHEETDRLDWAILDALGDEYRSAAEFVSAFREAAGAEAILDRMEHLHRRGLIGVVFDLDLDRTLLLAEIRGTTPDKRFWFRRRWPGYLAWGELALRYGQSTDPRAPVKGDPSIDQRPGPAAPPADGPND